MTAAPPDVADTLRRVAGPAIVHATLIARHHAAVSATDRHRDRAIGAAMRSPAIERALDAVAIAVLSATPARDVPAHPITAASSAAEAVIDHVVRAFGLPTAAVDGEPDRLDWPVHIAAFDAVVRVNNRMNASAIPCPNPDWATAAAARLRGLPLP